MPFPRINTGDSLAVVSQKSNVAIDFLNSASSDLNLSGHHVKNGGVGQFDQLYLGNQPFINIPINSGILCVATANPLVYNFTARQFLGNPAVQIDGRPLPATAYAIAGTAIPIGFTNPDFEAATLAPWSAGPSIAVSATNPHLGTGTKCAQILSAGGSLTQTISGLTVASTPTIEVYVRGDVGTTATVSVVVDDGTTGADAQIGTVTLTTSWQRIGFIYTVLAPGKARITLNRSQAGAGGIFFDDAKCYSVNNFTNGDFETGDLTGWTNSDFGLTASAPYSGLKCAFLSAPSQYLYQALFGLTPGMTYKITTQVRTDPSATATAYLQVHDGTGANLTPPVPTMAIPGTTWQLAMVNYTVNTTGNLGFALLRGPEARSAGTVYFDGNQMIYNYAPSTFTVTLLKPLLAGETMMVSGSILP